MNYSNTVSRTAAPPAHSDSRSQFVTEIDRRGRRYLTLRKPAEPARRGYRRFAALAVAAGALCSLSAESVAQNFSASLSSPTIDKWVYPFASSGGGLRTTAPVFGSIGSVGTFDDRDGQFLTGFDLAGQIPAGRGASNYVVTSVRLTLSLNFAAADLVVWDGTYDPISTYNPVNGAPINGDDPGRPIELYGVGYRGGFTALTMTETSAYTFGDPQAEGVRNFYATDYLGGTPRDVSNNFRDAFDPVPFAIGQVAPGDLNPDGTMKDGALITFDLNLANPDVLAYVRTSLNLGRLNLLTTSLHEASQGGPATRPEFDTKELGLAGTPASLQITGSVVPEPATLGIFALGAAMLGLRRREVRG
jgi:hypothetical protein